MLRESQCRSQLEHQNTDQLSLSTSTGLKHKQTPARVTFLHPLPSSLGPRPDAAFTGSSVLSWTEEPSMRGLSRIKRAKKRAFWQPSTAACTLLSACLISEGEKKAPSACVSVRVGPPLNSFISRRSNKAELQGEMLLMTPSPTRGREHCVPPLHC